MGVHLAYKAQVRYTRRALSGWTGSQDIQRQKSTVGDIMDKNLSWISIVFLFLPATANSNSAISVNGGAAVVFVSESGRLQYWKAGRSEPNWTYDLPVLFSEGARSRVAALGLEQDGTIFVAMRSGPIVYFSQDGNFIAAKTPVYSSIYLNVGFLDIDWDNWTSQVDHVGKTQAAWFDMGTNKVYLAPDDGSVVAYTSKTIAHHGDDTFFTTDFFNFFQTGPTSICITRKIAVPLMQNVGRWYLNGSSNLPNSTTALAHCSGRLVLGTYGGQVAFIPTSPDESGTKIRNVSSNRDGSEMILDVGCVGASRAFSVTLDSGNGQIQLWNMENMSVIGSVMIEADGHPGMAFTAVSSADGSEMMSLGDHDVRLWRLEENGLSLVKAHYFDGPESQSFVGTELDELNFVYWDGEGLWIIPKDGSQPQSYAGSL